MPIENRGFGALFAEKKNALDHLQARMASILPSFPGMPAAKYFDMAIGVDFHESVMPPLPICPVPHVGMIFDIMGAVVAAIASELPSPPPPPEVPEGQEPPSTPVTMDSIACAVVQAMKPSVKVHNQWIANAGAGIQHLPGIVAHLVPVIKPMATSEMWMGSSTVLADGGPFSTQFHPALSCNLVGFPALLRFNKPPKPKVSLMAPTSVLLTVIPGGAPVLVGGPPTIDLFQLMFKLALKGLGKLWKKAGNKLQDFINNIKTKHPKLGRVLQFVKCRFFGEPVDAATGRVYHTNRDFELPGPIPLLWERTYYSDAEVNGPLGYNWHHSYNLGIYDMGNGFFTIRLADGRETVMPALSLGELFYRRQEQLLWQKDTEGYLLTTSDKLMYRFNGPKNPDGYVTLSSIQNKQGFAIEFNYNKQGFLKKITDSSHRKLLVETDALGRILRIYTISEGKEINLIRYAYDATGNMVQTTDALDNKKHFYYEEHLLVKLTNQSGHNFHWEYQDLGDNAKCIHTWGDNGVLEYWTQYEEGKTTTRNSLGHTTEYYYDANKLIYKVVDANGGITHQIYNEYGELAVNVNPEGHSKKYIYNKRGQITKLINEHEEATTYTYDAQGNLTSLTTTGGRRMLWEYDDKDRIIKKTTPDANSLHYNYQGSLLNCITDSLKRDFYLKYDEHYNLVQVNYPKGDSHKWVYDDLGRVIEATDINGNINHYNYDVVGNIIWIREADGNEHQLSYDAAGNLVLAKDKEHLVQFSYGPLGVMRSRQQHGATVTFTYDTELQLRSIANEGGELYRFGLDALGQVVNEWGFDGMQRDYLRDGVGQIKKAIRPSGKWSSYEYDGTGNLVKEEHNDGSIAAYRYNKDGLLTEAFNEDGHIVLKRDEAGRIVKELQGKYEVSKKYDDQGNCSFTGSNLGAAIQMHHNADGFLETMQASDGHENWTAQWQRNNCGLELYRQMSGGVSVQIERDGLGHVLRRSIGAGNVEQSRTRYIWGGGYRLHRIVNELNSTQANFEYDVFDNLVSAEYKETNRTETIYRMPDKIGNLYKTRDRKDRVYGKGGQLQECPTYFYHYDREGNLVLKEFKKNENLIATDKRAYAKEAGIKLRGSGTGWAYEWGSNGMLRKVISPCGQTTRFSYDPLGRRIAKTHKNKVTRWVWDGNVPLHEWCYEGDYPPQMTIGENGKLQYEEEPVENLITWVFENGTFIPCAKLVGEEYFSIITDYLGTPTHAFDNTGNKVWERELDCYGKCRNLICNNSFCPYLYQGQYEDLETGLVYNRFRYYSSNEGIYISQDPIKLEGGKNFYGYVFDTNAWIDIYGLSSNPFDFLNEAFRQQGFQPGDPMTHNLKQSWGDVATKTDYEVRVHPANSSHGGKGDIFRVARRKSGVNAHGQGHGWEYLDQKGNWHHESILKPGKPGHPNPNFDVAAAKATHIEIPPGRVCS